jgi:hypothetical protein
MTTVVHMRDWERGDPNYVYIGRGGKWGNPFRIGGGTDRARAIELFRNWIVKQPKLMAALPELRGKRLVCYCHPLPCHGDVLAELVDRIEDRRRCGQR